LTYGRHSFPKYSSDNSVMSTAMTSTGGQYAFCRMARGT
jgi:hypothetical protein